MSLGSAYTSLGAVLAGNTELLEWLSTHNLGLSFTVLKGNREVEKIIPKEIPAIVLELGDAKELHSTIGSYESEGEHKMKLSIVWEEKDEELAFDQSTELPELVIKALLNNPTLDDGVDGAMVTNFKSDYGYNHPRHAMGFTVNAMISIQRT